MSSFRLYYATNRNHVGADRWHPEAYGSKFSDDGIENLRFGVVDVEADETKVSRFINKKLGDAGEGAGEDLGAYLAKCAESADITAYQEKLSSKAPEQVQKNLKLGSTALFADVQAEMMACSDVLLYIHGFNVSWFAAVGAALALQLMLRNSPAGDSTQSVVVVLFTWPSDGMALPWTSYRSDRTEAAGSGAAVGRGLLKVRDFLAGLRDKGKGGVELCGQDMHLLCHSMGNFVLQNALARVAEFTPGNALSRIFEHVFLCAPDVDDAALEPGQPLARVHEIARNVSVYHNRNDAAMVVSDYTKGNPERLGGTGAARPALLHNKIHQIDCTSLAAGLIGHSYYLNGKVNADIRASIDGLPQDDSRRLRERSATLSNVWIMRT